MLSLKARFLIVIPPSRLTVHFISYFLFSLVSNHPDHFNCFNQFMYLYVEALIIIVILVYFFASESAMQFAVQMLVVLLREDQGLSY